MIKTVIFDYDGVIVDSFANIHEVYKIICEELGKQCPTSLEVFRKIYGFNFKECYKNLGITEEEHSKAQAIFKREILKKKPKLFTGIRKVIRDLSKAYDLILVSATYKQEVLQKLNRFGLANFFTAIIARENATEEDHISKSKIIIDFMRRQNLTPEEVISIGDRDIDYVVGKKAGLQNIILVEYGWGYHKETNPHQSVAVRKPADLLKAIKAIDLRI